jgi:hypothetical protein
MAGRDGNNNDDRNNNCDLHIHKEVLYRQGVVSNPEAGRPAVAEVVCILHGEGGRRNPHHEVVVDDILIRLPAVGGEGVGWVAVVAA